MRPTQQQVLAAAHVLRDYWDIDGRFVGGDATAYQEWAFGIVDLIQIGAPSRAIEEYLGMLEEQLGEQRLNDAEHVAIASRLRAAL